MSVRAEKTDKSVRGPRDRAKVVKEKELTPESSTDSSRGEGESTRSVSPKNGKRKKIEMSIYSASPGGAGVRFDSLGDKSTNREKISSRSSSAGPTTPSDGKARGEPIDEADSIMMLFQDFVSQMSSPLQSIARKNIDLRSQVSMLLKASQSEEAPFVAMAREKENLAREYDQLRYEHQRLLLDFQHVHRENLHLLGTIQQLQAEINSLKNVSQSPPPTDNSELIRSLSSPSSTRVSPALTLKRKDNVAELEQSILELAEEIEEILSPRSNSTSGSGSSKPTPPPEITPTKDTPTRGSKRKVHKSHSNDPPNSSLVHSPSNGSTGSTRAKAPPERVVSAPSEAKSTSPTAARHSKSSRLASSSPTSTSTSINTKNVEEREEARLTKYTSGNLARRSNPNMNSKVPIVLPKLPSSTPLTTSEQITFAQLFRKWDINDDDVIDRHQLQVTYDSMSSYEALKDLHTIAHPHYSKIDWPSLGITQSTPISLLSALTYLSDCKAGIASASIFAKT